MRTIYTSNELDILLNNLDFDVNVTNAETYNRAINQLMLAFECEELKVDSTSKFKFNLTKPVSYDIDHIEGETMINIRVMFPLATIIAYRTDKIFTSSEFQHIYSVILKMYKTLNSEVAKSKARWILNSTFMYATHSKTVVSFVSSNTRAHLYNEMHKMTNDMAELLSDYNLISVNCEDFVIMSEHFKLESVRASVTRKMRKHDNLAKFMIKLTRI